jgi:hypothetical protein
MLLPFRCATLPARTAVAKNNSGLQIYWMTVSYRTVLMAVAGLVLATCIVVYFVFPNSEAAALINNAGNQVLQKMGIGGPAKDPGGREAQQAHFTNIEGSVKIKKASSNAWINADYVLPLEKGDVVQTSSDGMAKLVFGDGTNYTVKQDSLIVVEENSSNAQQTAVAVQVTTGTVDLSTASYSVGSKSQVIVAGATASLAPLSSAMVHNDPRADEHEILIKKGGGNVTRNNETVSLANFESVTFKADSPTMTKQKEIGPPTLIAPANMMPVYLTGVSKAIDFSWSPISASSAYRIRISRNPYFSSTVFEKVLTGTDTKIAGLREGTYYWVVTSQDAAGKESVESERNQFSVITRAPEDASSMALDIQPFIQHGHVIEIKGKTDPQARVMVNGSEVPFIKGDGTFSFFTPPLPRGENIITVTAQNTRGGVKTQQKRVVIE